MDKITLKNLRVNCIVGTFPEERETKQTIIINIDLFCDLRKAGISDDLKDTVDYFEIEQEVVKFVEESNYFLLEAIAENIAKLCLSKNSILKTKIQIAKPAALEYADSAIIEIERS